MAQGVRLLALCFSCAAAAQPPPAQDDAPDQRIDFYELEAQRRAQGLRLTHYDYPPYGETQCKTLIDVQPWSPGGQIPFSCMMDRLKRLYLLAQDTWALGSELRAKQVALADRSTHRAQRCSCWPHTLGRAFGQRLRTCCSAHR